MPTNKKIYITYIGRLEKEKGIEIVISCIRKSIEENRGIVWNICGEGSYKSIFDTIDHENLVVHGQLHRDQIKAILKKTDMVLMPSLFLETFGLVALETLSLGIPVCGFDKGGLVDFIHPDLMLDAGNPVDSFFQIIDRGNFPLLDISGFSYEKWLQRLTELTEGFDKILLINDYTVPVGGAESYIQGLVLALESLGKVVETYGYNGSINRFTRIFLMLLAPISFWRGKNIAQKIHNFQPDLIWMHSILRYIGPFGIHQIMNSSARKYISHHDLGLISLRPSNICSESDIPKSSHLADWMPKKINIFSIIGILPKWLYIHQLWSILQVDKGLIHIVPSHWMQGFFGKYSHSTPLVYGHATTIDTQTNL